jgi:hypothetical protein
MKQHEKGLMRSKAAQLKAAEGQDSPLVTSRKRSFGWFEENIATSPGGTDGT